ncbi:MAG: tetratricopeptide repeat protein [Verrucomicrobia subdivision 3 bacterium]|nr:tetratricopeptide repeat protein [Limisphaerales bacterium]
MLPRLVGATIMLPLLLALGCSRQRAAQVDERRNPYFLEGKERIGTRDYKGAIAAFEKALEANPRSPLAHFELGVLYEQHSDQREDDYVSALYHYNQAVRLRPHAYPADNARQRIASCKQELVRSQSMAPVYQQTIRELDRLKEENQQLKRQLETLQLQAASHFVAPASLPGRQSLNVSSPSRSAPEPTATETPVIVQSNNVASAERALTPKRARTHTVRHGDTAYSIARAYRVSVNSLLAANPTLEARRLKIGQAITIPPP